MENQKPTKVFWQKSGSDVYCIDGRHGTAINEEQKEKLMQLMQNDFYFITVKFEKLPLNK